VAEDKNGAAKDEIRVAEVNIRVTEEELRVAGGEVVDPEIEEEKEIISEVEEGEETTLEEEHAPKIS
jgi:hypothetical protein